MTRLAGEENGEQIVAPNLRDLDILGTRLTAWLAERMPHARDLRLSNLAYPRGAGLSHETILFDADFVEDGKPARRGLVVRIKPMNSRVFLDDHFEDQYGIMQVMHSSGLVRVAEPLWIERRSDLLGSPFFVMEKRMGRVAVSYPPYLTQGWVFDATPAQRRTMWRNAIRQLGAIARVPVSAASFLEAKEGKAQGFRQEWERWRRMLEWIMADRPLPVLQKAWSLIEGSLPAHRPPGIVWGDARIGNMMVDDDFRIVAVMDWEHPSLGGALHDLGWWLFTERLHTEGRGYRRLDGMPDRDETVAIWEEASGLAARDLEWYERFAAFKLSCLEARLFIARGKEKPGENASDNASSRLLMQLLDMSPSRAVS